MSTAARKARKRAGESAPVKPIKVATPVEERAEFNRATFDVKSSQFKTSSSSQRRLRRELEARGLGGDAA